MQDRYAGDVGDYLKYGLLRWLCAAEASHPTLRLGIVWYRVLDEDHNHDGKHVTYLEPGHREAERLRTLDPDLYDRLAKMVVEGGQRSVAAVEAAGVLPSGTRTFASFLDFRDLPSRAMEERRARRSSWLDRAMAATHDCDLIFADPDNGFRPKSHRVPRSRTNAVKHAYLDELAKFVARGQSLVVYHHAGRRGSIEQQVRWRLAELSEQVPGCTPLGCVIARLGSVRLLLVAAAEPHRSFLSRKLQSLQTSVWAETLQVQQ
ncbi:MAG: hypothetical protein M0027_00260 [Candidatus Dormibacteraeota bacterium]|nr:hypothetical protein [Candidatus Dormibacteraeota bacterium]